MINLIRKIYTKTKLTFNKKRKKFNMFLLDTVL